MKRDAHAESLRLHRARRALERVTFDSNLMDADDHLDECRCKMVAALLAVMQRKPLDAEQRIASAIECIDQARRYLRQFFDDLGSKDDDDARGAYSAEDDR